MYVTVNYDHSAKEPKALTDLEDGQFFRGVIEGNRSLFLRVGTRVVDLEQTESTYPVRGTTVEEFSAVNSVTISVN